MNSVVATLVCFARPKVSMSTSGTTQKRKTAATVATGSPLCHIEVVGTSDPQALGASEA